MFEQYPKQRPVLPAAYQAIYEKHYKENRSGSTSASYLSGKMEEWMHRRVAADVQGSEERVATLELGAGSLNHLRYEPAAGIYDVVEPFEPLLNLSPGKDRVTEVYQDISHIPSQKQYDRIISIAVLEHLTDLPSVIARSGLLLTPQGRFRSGIPNEGTLLWTLGYRLTTGIEFWMRYRKDYGKIMHHEHVNTAQEIDEVLKYFFEEVSCRVLGLSRYLGFYRFYDCGKPIRERCEAFLSSRQGN